MRYTFICPVCNKQEIIEMSISEYKSEGHYCSCGAELVRDPKSFCQSYQAKCDGFYGKTSN